ncbi:MAG: radical SAM protein [Gemmatimonadaceae bacterium]
MIRETTGVCPQCLERVPATVVERNGRVFLRKTCRTHGEDEALIASDARFYWNATPTIGAACGCAAQHSCSLIFEITERCNLTCPTCFTASSPHHTWTMPFADFAAKLDRLRARGKSDADVVQISGGEPTVHPEFERILAYCFESGVAKVYVNTNGVRVARDRQLVDRLAAIDGGSDRLQFYLQFDGTSDATYTTIRGVRGFYAVKQRAVSHLLDAGLFVLPVMTVTRGVNLHEIGDLIRLVLAQHPKMNTVMLQPAFYAGRYEHDQSAPRLTTAELAHAVAAQSDGLFAAGDFGPIPCGDPNCFALAVAFVQDGRVLPVSRYFPRFENWSDPDVAPLVSRLTDQLPATMLETLAEEQALDQLLDLLGRSDDSADWVTYRDFFIVAIKPFMDAYTYDQRRVDSCCVHVIDRAGEPVSLCEYNVLRRPRGLL